MGFWETLKRWIIGGGGDPAPNQRPSATARSASAPEDEERDVESRAPRKPLTFLGAAFVAPDILGLTAAQLRTRIMRLSSARNFGWLAIPPQSDERTALIDRALELRGLLTRAQLDEIHRIGDEWGQHNQAKAFARAVAHGAADAAVAAERAERAALKEQKRAAAAARRAAHAEAVRQRRAEDIVFVGRGVSAKLGERDSNLEALRQAALPELATAKDLAQVLGISVPQLRWLCFHNESAPRTHYIYFEIPKRSGGTRLLASPNQHLRRAQHWILEHILERVTVHDAAHGFVRGRSTVTNAKPHCGQRIVVNLDLSDFFPSVTFPRVRGLFESFGYSPAVATLLALICTEAPRTAVELDGRRYWVAVAERALPQGACTSPSIANLVTRKLDRRLGGAARKLGFTYTRYADDLTFSASAAGANVALLRARVRHIIAEEGFALNAKKGRVQRRGHRQEVTGIVVNNDRPAIARDELRRLRAILHNARRTGLAAQNREQLPNFQAWLHGKIGYIKMVDPIQGQRLADALAACPE